LRYSTTAKEGRCDDCFFFFFGLGVGNSAAVAVNSLVSQSPINSLPACVGLTNGWSSQALHSVPIQAVCKPEQANP
jgi:hypothetical protein